MGNIRRVEKWVTPDGRMHDTFDEATKHEQRYIQRENMREYLAKAGITITGEREELILQKIAFYIVSEFEPS